MKNKGFYLWFILLVTIFGCGKDVWVFDSPVNNNIEPPLLLTINKKPCALDIRTKTFRYPIEEKNVSNFKALVRFKNYSSLKFNGINLKNGKNNNFGAIEVNKPYELEFNIQGEKNIFTLYFTTIPTVQIITQEAIDNEPKVFAWLLVNYKENNIPTVNSVIGIELRGISSLKYPKKSFGFKLLHGFDKKNKKSLSFFNKKSNSKWILDALYNDEAKARNKTSLKLWQTLPDDVEHLGTSCEYVEVFINYESLGLYAFCEKLNSKFLSLNPESVLVTGKLNNANTYFQEMPSTKPLGSLWAGWEQKYPKVDKGNDWVAFEALVNLVTEGSDQEFIDDIYNHINFDNFVDYFLYVNILKGYDDIGKNWYLLKKSHSEKFMIVPWDLDSSWGRDGKGAKVNIKKIVTNGIYKRLTALNPNQFKEKLKARWAVLKNNEMSPSTLIGLFDENFEILNQSNLIEIDNQIWSKNVDLTTERAYLNYWIQVNWDYTDEYIDSL